MLAAHCWQRRRSRRDRKGAHPTKIHHKSTKVAVFSRCTLFGDISGPPHLRLAKKIRAELSNDRLSNSLFLPS